MTDDDIRSCPICRETWTNVKQIGERWFVYHFCEKAQAYIAWNHKGAPLDITDRVVNGLD